MDLSLFWFALIIFATLMYIIMDGFDLGVGMLFAVEHTRSRRDVMVNTVAPVWDGNETWLVLGAPPCLVPSHRLTLQLPITCRYH